MGKVQDMTGMNGRGKTENTMQERNNEQIEKGGKQRDHGYHIWK